MFSCSSEYWERVVYLESHVLYPAWRRSTCSHGAARALPSQVRERVFEQHGNGSRLQQRYHSVTDYSDHPSFFLVHVSLSLHLHLIWDSQTVSRAQVRLSPWKILEAWAWSQRGGKLVVAYMGAGGVGLSCRAATGISGCRGRPWETSEVSDTQSRACCMYTRVKNCSSSAEITILVGSTAIWTTGATRHQTVQNSLYTGALPFSAPHIFTLSKIVL